MINLIIGGLIGVCFMCLFQINRDNESQNKINKVNKYIDKLLKEDDPMYLDAVLITIKEILGGKE